MARLAMRRALLLLLLPAGLVLGTALSFGQGSSSATVTGCVKKKTGALRVLKAGQRCTRGETRLRWNQRGPRGPAGAAGAPGAAGSKGPAGAKGETGDSGVPASFDEIDGKPCDPGSGPSTVDLSYGSNGYARFEC